MTQFCIGTASCSHFFLQTQQMLYSLQDHLPNNTTVLLLDNGLTAHQINILMNNFGFVKIKFFQKELTPWERSSYIFKTYIHEIALENYSNHIYLWLDAKTNLKYNQSQLLQILKKQPVYSHIPFSQAEELWTDKRTIELMELSFPATQTPQFQASAMIFDFRTNEAKEFMKELIKYNKRKEVITPEGSFKGVNPPTHRQDQSVFSCLLKKYGYVDNYFIWARCHNTLMI